MPGKAGAGSVLAAKPRYKGEAHESEGQQAGRRRFGDDSVEAEGLNEVRRITKPGLTDAEGEVTTCADRETTQSDRVPV